MNKQIKVSKTKVGLLDLAKQFGRSYKSVRPSTNPETILLL